MPKTPGPRRPSSTPDAENDSAAIQLYILRQAVRGTDEVETFAFLREADATMPREELTKIIKAMPSFESLPGVHVAKLPENVYSALLHTADHFSPIAGAIEHWVGPAADLPAEGFRSTLHLHHPAYVRPWTEVTGWSGDQKRLLSLLIKLIPADRLAAAVESGQTVESIADRMAATVPSRNELDESVGPFYDTAGLVKWLGVTKQAIAYRVETRSLLGVRTTDGHWLYPSFQFDVDGRSLPRLREVIDAIDGENTDAWQTAIWLNHPLVKLNGMTPAVALRTGVADMVVEIARRISSALAS